MNNTAIQNEAQATIALKDIFDLVYAETQRPETLVVHLGIWETEDVPFTFYATLCDREQKVLFGEQSYGADTLEEAIQALYENVVDYLGTDQCPLKAIAQ